MKATVKYIPNAFNGNIDADTAFIDLWRGLQWERRDGVPRREFYVARPDAAIKYTYGTPPHARTYDSRWASMDVNADDALRALWAHAELISGCTFDVCFINGYEGCRDHIGWHSDDSPEMDDERPIAIVSLGAARDISFRRKMSAADAVALAAQLKLPAEDILANPKRIKMDIPERLRLQPGSICIMPPGMQDTHQHKIPKAGVILGPRISLTFRGYVEPGVRNPHPSGGYPITYKQ